MRSITRHLCDLLYFIRLRAIAALVLRIRDVLIWSGMPNFLYRLLKRNWTPIRERLTLPMANPSYEPEVADYCTVENGKCFVDAGANIGVYTVRMAKQGVEVHAFEPSPDIYRELCHNVKDYPNVQTYPYALSNRNGMVQFILMRNNLVRNRFLISNPETVRHYTPDRIMNAPSKTIDSLDIPNIGLIKVDVEGHEHEVLCGAMRTLQTQKPRLIIEVHHPIWRNDIRVMSVLHEVGYRNIRRVWVRHHRKFFTIADG